MIGETDHFEEQQEKRAKESNKQTDRKAVSAKMCLDALQSAETIYRFVQTNKNVDEVAEPIESTSSSSQRHLFHHSDGEGKEMIFLNAQLQRKRAQTDIMIHDDRLSIEQRRVEQEALSSNRAFILQSQLFEFDQPRI